MAWHGMAGKKKARRITPQLVEATPQGPPPESPFAVPMAVASPRNNAATEEEKAEAEAEDKDKKEGEGGGQEGEEKEKEKEPAPAPAAKPKKRLAPTLISTLP
jgi:hypothetical protein